MLYSLNNLELTMTTAQILALLAAKAAAARATLRPLPMHFQPAPVMY